MKILQITPIYIPLRPDLKYGGIERVVLALGRTFSEAGHNVINAAPADSVPYGELLPTLKQSEWTRPKIHQNPNAYDDHINKIIDFLESEQVDVIHDHTGNFVLSGSFAKRKSYINGLKEIPIVVTPHELKRFKKSPLPKQDNIFFTALSEYQKNVFSEFVPVQRVIHNGVFIEEYPFKADKERYLFSLGSIERDKGQDLAVKAALETGIPIKVGGKIEEQDFYDLEVRLAGGNKVEYIGELNDEQKKEFYVNALAFLAPIRIGDCFSLTRIESLACGTPVVTLNAGSAREAIKHKETGYVVPYDPENENQVVEEMANCISSIKDIDPRRCRLEAETRFDWRKISEEYLDFYNSIISGKN